MGGVPVAHGRVLQKKRKRGVDDDEESESPSGAQTRPRLLRRRAPPHCSASRACASPGFTCRLADRQHRLSANARRRQSLPPSPVAPRRRRRPPLPSPRHRRPSPALHRARARPRLPLAAAPSRWPPLVRQRVCERDGSEDLPAACCVFFVCARVCARTRRLQFLPRHPALSLAFHERSEAPAQSRRRGAVLSLPPSLPGASFTPAQSKTHTLTHSHT